MLPDTQKEMNNDVVRENEIVRNEVVRKSEVVNEVSEPCPKPSGFLEFLKVFCVVLVLVYFIQQLLIRPFVVEGQSMFPTFNTDGVRGDYLLVERVSYYFGEPERGDIVVAKGTGKADVAPYVVKRVVGLPGETLLFKGSSVYITDVNDETFVLNEPYIKSATAIQYADKTTTLAPDEYYLLGDNRNGSFDSRRVGAFKRKNFYGKVLVRLYPFDDIALRPGEIRYKAEV